MKRVERLGREYAKKTYATYIDGTGVQRNRETDDWTPFDSQAAEDFQAGYQRAIEDAVKAAASFCPECNNQGSGVSANVHLITDAIQALASERDAE